MQDEIDYMANVFIKTIEDNSKRLEHGAKLREEMKNSLLKGESLTGYRAAWIKSSSTKVIKLLRNICVDFDTQHSDDKASVQDMFDILNTSINALRKYVKKKL